MQDDRCDLLCLDLDVAERLRSIALERDAELRDAAERARGLGEPTRLGLAVALAQADELCGCDLAWISGRAQNLVSHHMRALRAQGLVESRRDGKLVMFSLTDDGKALLDAVLRFEVTA